MNAHLPAVNRLLTGETPADPAQQESGGALLTLTPLTVDEPPFQSVRVTEPTTLKDTKPMPQMQSPLAPSRPAVSPTFSIHNA